MALDVVMMMSSRWSNETTHSLISRLTLCTSTFVNILSFSTRCVCFRWPRVDPLPTGCHGCGLQEDTFSSFWRLKSLRKSSFGAFSSQHIPFKDPKPTTTTLSSYLESSEHFQNTFLSVQCLQKQSPIARNNVQFCSNPVVFPPLESKLSNHYRKAPITPVYLRLSL